MSAPIPPRVRSELVARADGLAVVPLSLVVAPAGSGKSTLLAAWRRRLAESGETTAYLDLSPLHADAAVFAADLLEVVRHVRPGFGDETSRALAQRAGEAEPWQALARAWLRDAASLDPPLVAFLDNFHELGPNVDGARWIDEVVRGRRPQLSLVISSRGSVPPCAARLRGEGSLVEVTSADLSLRAGEVEDLLADHGVARDESLAARVLARTEGWATGVQLAARSLARIEPARRDAFLERLGREPDLFGFVAAEVLRDESPELIAAVEAVALLGRCTPRDVAELLGEPAAESAVVRAVERGVLLSDGDLVFVHQLWRDFVTERIGAQRSVADRRTRVRSAGAILRRERRYEAALACFAEVGDWEALARTLLETAEAWTREGRGERVRHWIARVPDALVERTPALLALRGIATMRPAPQLALPDLERAMEMYRARGSRSQERALAGTIGVLHMTQLRREDAMRALRRMISLRGVLTDPAERGGLYALLAQRRYLMGRFDGALAMAQRAAHQPLDPSADWFNTMLLAWLRAGRGEWVVALRDVDRVLARPEVNASSFLHYAGRVIRSRLLTMTGDPAAALVDAERAEEAFRDHRVPFVREVAAFAIANAKWRLGELDEARSWYAEVLRRASERGGGADAPARVQYALDLIDGGELAEAAREARLGYEAILATGDRWTTLMPWLVGYALWAMSAGGDVHEAQLGARRHARLFALPALPLTHATLCLALADVERRAGDAAAAERHARRGFEIASRAGLRVVEPFAGKHLVPVWAAWALRAGVCPDFALDWLESAAPDPVAPLLAELARDPDVETRARAVAMLARRGGRSAFEPLRGASADPDARVRDAAKAALATLDLRPSFALSVRSLGELAVARGGVPVAPEEWKGQTARRLFARLLVADGRPLAREQIREDLWPDTDPDAGRNNLRVAVTRLNDALDPERPSGASTHFVVAAGDALRLDFDSIADWDVARFRSLLRDAAAGDAAHELATTSAALACYAGPLLPEIDDAWVVPLRRELADRFAAAAQRAGPRLVLRGRLDEAAALAEQMLRADPADEHAFALRMRVQLARRDRAAALRTYEEAVATLARELDLAPGEELRELAARARSS